jgi:YebC/PmpR family DNA-binding regulatory protein
VSGHSKWSTIKRKKEKADAQRGKLFSQLIKEIIVAARMGGGDVSSNTRLRTAVQSAKNANMPSENIDRAIKKGTGELPGVNYEEAVYEGYGPAGVAIMAEILTDNRNRTTSELRHIFSKHGGRLGEVGCVAWMFEEKGVVTIEKSRCDEDTILAVALETKVDDMNADSPEYYELTMTPELLEMVRNVLTERGIHWTSAEVTKQPMTTVSLDQKEAEQVLRLMEALEEQDDTQRISANFDISNEILAALGQ